MTTPQPRPIPVTEPVDRPEVMICTPTYNGLLSDAYVESLIDTIVNGREAPAIDISWSAIAQGCFLTVNRDILVEAFLASKATHLLFADADVRWGADAVRRLLAHQVPIVGAPIPDRGNSGRINVLPEKDDLRPASILLPVRGIGTGFLLCERQVVQALSLAAPEYLYVNRRLRRVFHTEIIDASFTGEDYLFCREALGLGFKSYVDLTLQVDHLGTTWFSLKEPNK